MPGDRQGARVDIGDEVEVHTTFNDTWSRGFVVAAVDTSGYVVRRISDGRLLPAPTGPEDLRPVPRPRQMR